MLVLRSVESSVSTLVPGRKAGAAKHAVAAHCYEWWLLWQCPSRHFGPRLPHCDRRRPLLPIFCLHDVQMTLRLAGPCGLWACELTQQACSATMARLARLACIHGIGKAQHCPSSWCVHVCMCTWWMRWMLEDSAAPRKPTGLSGLCRNRISSGMSPSGPRSITCMSKDDWRQLSVTAKLLGKHRRQCVWTRWHRLACLCSRVFQLQTWRRLPYLSACNACHVDLLLWLTSAST